MLTEEKLKLVRNYFKERFQNETVADRFSDKYMAKLFTSWEKTRGSILDGHFWRDIQKSTFQDF